MKPQFVFCVLVAWFAGGWPLLSAQETRILQVSIDSPGLTRLWHTSDTNSYYLLMRGDQVTAVTLAVDAALGRETQGELAERLGAAPRDTAFYRVRQIPLQAPLDTDHDGIDDVYELRRGAFLDPLDRFDAFLDFDGDGRSNWREYRDGTDPASAESRAVALVETSPVPGETEVNVVRETILRFDGPIEPATVNTNSFYLLANGARVAGRVVASSTERFATFFYDEPLPSATQISAVVNGSLIRGRNGLALDADRDLRPGGTNTFAFRTLPLSRIPGTRIFGFVRDSFTSAPIEGATVRVDAFPEADAVTDANGRFELVDMPAPVFFVHVDGSTATNLPAGFVYPSVGKPFHSVPGQTVQLNHHGHVFDIYLPPMAVGDVQALAGTQATDVGFGAAGRQTLTNMFPGVDPSLFDLLAVRIAPGAAYDETTMAVATQAIVIPVPPDRLPSPLPPGVNPRLVISIQPLGATSFDVPASVTFPNLDGLAPGAKATLWSFDHDAGHFVPIGNMTVSGDGRTLTTDPGVGVVAPGWHFVSDPRNWNGDDGKPGEGNAGDEVEPRVDMRWVMPGSSEKIQFTFGAPTGPVDEAGVHALEKKAVRRITFRLRGPFEEYFQNDGERKIRFNHTYTLSPGDPALHVEATLRTLEEIEAKEREGRPFGKDRIYGAEIFMRDKTEFPDGSTTEELVYVLPFAYVDVSDDAADGTLRFTDALVGRTQKRAFEIARGVPDFTLLSEGADSGDFATGNAELAFTPRAVGDKAADLRLQVTVDGKAETSLNTLSLQGKGAEIQRLALNKAELAATLALLLKTNDTYQLQFRPNTANFRLSFGGNSTRTLTTNETANTLWGALSALPGIGLGDVSVVDAESDNGQRAFLIQFQGALEGTGTPLGFTGDDISLVPLVYNQSPNPRISTNEMSLINTPEKRRTIADQVEARVRDRLGELLPGLEVVDPPGAQGQTIKAEYRLGGIGQLLGRAISGTGPNNDNVAFPELLQRRAQLRPGQLAFTMDQSVNAFLSASVIVFPDTFFESSRAGDLADPTNNPPSLLVDGIAKTILHEAGHTLGAVHVYTEGNPTHSIAPNGVPGATDIMRSGFDSTVSGLALQSGISKEFFKLALNLDFIPAEALMAFDYLEANFTHNPQFDADGPDPNSTPPLNGTFLFVRGPAGRLWRGELEFGGVLVDGAGGIQAVVPVQLHNGGSVPVTIHSVTLDHATNGFSITPVAAGTVLASGQSVTLELVFDPVSGGSASTMLRVLSTDSHAPAQKFFLGGFGVEPNAVFSLSMDDDDNSNFGGVELGASATKALTIRNLGASNLSFTLVATSRSADFDLGGFENTPLSLAFGQSLQIPVTFAPTRLGLSRLLFSFTTSDPERPAVKTSVVGTGIRAGGALAGDAVWGGDFVAIDQGSFTERLNSNPEGHFMSALPTFSPYAISVFDAASGYLATGSGMTGPAAAFRGLTGGLTWQASSAQDTDGDGLPDDIEHAIGTALNNSDTDGDGVDDFTEVMQGLNPADGVAMAVGIVGSLDLPGVGRDVEVATFVDAQGGQRDLAFVVLSGAFSGLFIADVSNPRFPIALGRLELPFVTSAADVEVDVATRLAVFATGSGLYTIDVSNPLQPALVASAPNTPASSLELVEGLIYANSSAGIRVLDAVTLDELSIIPVPVTDLEHDRGHLYAAGGGQLSVVDVRDPSAPALRGSIAVGVGLDLFAGNGLVILGAPDGPRLLDVSNPEAPRRLDDGDAFPENFGVALNGSGLALAARDNFGLSLYNISDPANITSLLNLNTGRSRDVRVHEGIAVTVGGRFFSESLGVLTTVSFLPFDGAGQPPTVSLTANVTDMDAGRTGVQVVEGTPIPVSVVASDDRQVRRVELLVNGLVTQVDTAFPFNFTTLVPSIVGQAATLTLQAKASDMALNEAATQPLVIEILADRIGPVLASSVPAEGGNVFAPVALSLTFSEVLDESALSLGAVSLLELGGNGVVGGGDDTAMALAGIELRGLGQRVAVTPSGTLAPGRYRLAIVTNILRDLVGNLSAAPVALQFTVRPPLAVVAASGTPADANLPSLNVGQSLVVESVVDPRLVRVRWPTLDAVGTLGSLTLGAQTVDTNASTAAFPAPPLATTGNLTVFGSGATNVTKLLKWDVTSGGAIVRGQDSQGGQSDNRFPGNGLYVHWRALQAGHTPFAMRTRDPIALEPGNYELSFSAHGFGDLANVARFTVSVGSAFSEEFQFSGAATAFSNLTRTITVTAQESAHIVVAESGGLAFNAGSVDNFRLTRLSDSQVIFEDNFSLGVVDDTFMMQIVPTLTGGDMTTANSDFPGGGFRLIGSGFAEGDLSVRFGHAVLTDVNLVGSPDVTGSNAALNLIVPLDAAFGPITVATAGGTSAPLAVRLDEIVAAAARGTPANPALAAANVGQVITLRGQGFTLQSDIFLMRIDIGGVVTRRPISPQTVNSAGTEATLLVPDNSWTAAVNVPGNQADGAPGLQIVPTLDQATTEGSIGRVYLTGSGFVEGSGAYTLGPGPEQTVIDSSTGTAAVDVISDGGANRGVRLASAPAFGFGQARVSGPGGVSEFIDVQMINPALQRALYAVAVDPASGDLFAAAGGAASYIARVDRATGRTNAIFDLPNANVVDSVGLDILSEPSIVGGIAVPAGALLVFNGESSPDEIVAMNPANGSVLVTLTLAGNFGLVGGAYDPITDHFFVVHPGTPDLILEIHPATGATIRSFACASEVANGGMALDPTTGHFWIASTAHQRLDLVSREDGSLIRSVDVAAQLTGNVLTGVAVDRDGRLLGSSVQGVIHRFEGGSP